MNPTALVEVTFLNETPERDDDLLQILAMLNILVSVRVGSTFTDIYVDEFHLPLVKKFLTEAGYLW